MRLDLHRLEPKQHFTQPPPRFSEASLVKELEENGIGRPSTYASILSTIRDKGYVEMLRGYFRPSELGFIVNDLLVISFPDVFDVEFTAKMENNLDLVETDQVNSPGDPEPVLHAVQKRPRHRGREDGEHQGGGLRDRPEVPGMRKHPAHQDREKRPLHRLQRLPRVPVLARLHPRRERPHPAGGAAGRRGDGQGLREVRQTHGDQTRPLR